ncbi:hypothetical protein D9758_015215 [Tetrapyrgos nigripes]|uniref:Zinc finger Mcm10/DnaG-type domain-containing protein n=1 Tax=Tetrapyrgos nigripes TaxID=182062 RepID=A0A8H5CLI5_9AGAR|nr:hypothetical protein D9758_015215 [Tetrapyrgos nigripes]
MSELSAQERDQIAAQIAALQARLNDKPTAPVSPKRKKPGPVELAPATPSPKKKRKIDDPVQKHFPSSSSSRGALRTVNGSSSSKSDPLASKPAPSKLLNRIASMDHASQNDAQVHQAARTSAFTERPHVWDASPAGSSSKRNEDLTITENIPLGPADHKPPFDDPHFERLEPNSGIRLSSRSLPHDELQSHLEGRYYISPSLLYSSIRLLPDKQGYDIPVPGDWVTIAVVAERGPIKHSRAPIGIGKEDGSGNDKQKQKQKDNTSEANSGPKGKRYINMKLIDFGSRSSGSSSATGGKSVIRGDAFLSLLLFEADGCDLHVKEEGKKPQKVYRGGSRGAFEAMSKLKEGDVIALLNPRILKPFQSTSDKPHPTTNILAITPESAESITTIGRAKDLGMCCVTRRDGKPCGAWCDLRINNVCDYHIEMAVKHARSGRPEFSAGTSGLSNSAAVKRKHPSKHEGYDPKRQWGLIPEQRDIGTTYVVSGHIVKGDNTLTSQEVMENYGREGQAKAQRIEKKKEEERSLKALLKRDREGMEAVLKAREEMARIKQRQKSRDGPKKKTSGEAEAESDSDNDDGKHKRAKGKKKAARSEDSDGDDESIPKKRYKTYSADVIKHLGFDPTLARMKTANSNTGTISAQNKLDALAALHTSRKPKDIDLGPRPGPKIRSGVFAPTSTSTPVAAGKSKAAPADDEEAMIDLDSE